jgi:cystathionine gamma-synthase
MTRPLSPETLAAQALGQVDGASGALVPPIHPSTIYEQNPDGSYHDGHAYTRADNPTYEHAERLLATLEGGAACMLLPSGNAAAVAVFQSLLPGDHVLVSRILFWGIRKWLAEFALTWGLDVEFVDTSDLAAVRRGIRPGRTRLVWVETPSNPTWEVTDLQGVSDIARDANVRVAVDSTVATPVLTRPIEFGADLVVHSATKYLNGHSDVLAGAIVTARPDPFWERLRSWRRNAGSVLGPFEAWLLQRGMRTLFVRVRRSSASALALAQDLQGHPALTAVLYPGLPSHPGHGIAARQMDGGFGGMLSIRLAGGLDQARAVAAAVRVFKRATSLGGVESLIEHRQSTEGPSSPVPEDLLRLSIGLESVDDLRADLESALEQATRAGAARPPMLEGPSRGLSPGTDDAHAAAAALLERSVLPSVIARGGALRLLAVKDGVATLEVSGSPGAVLPLTTRIQGLLRAARPEITDLRVVSPAGEAAPEAPPDGVEKRLQRVLDEEVNPAVAAHGGRVILVGVIAGRAHVRLEGRCQGCSLAEVTVRQGIEQLCRARLPEIVAVVDVTDHSAGTDPFYTSAKR